MFRETMERKLKYDWGSRFENGIKNELYLNLIPNKEFQMILV